MVCLKYIQVKFFLDSPRIQKLNVIFLFPTSRHQYKYQIVYIWDRPFNSLRASVLYDSLLAERLALGALVYLFCNLHYWHVIDEAVEANLFLYFLSLQGWLKRFFLYFGLGCNIWTSWLWRAKLDSIPTVSVGTCNSSSYLIYGLALTIN